MTAKEYLSKGIDIDIKIKAIKLAEEKEKSNENEAVCEVLDKMKKESEQIKIDIITRICAIENNLYSAVLLNKYISNLTWAELAEEIDKEYDYTKGVLHNKALSEFSKNNAT